MKPKAIILHAPKTNRDNDAELALKLAGAEFEIVHINQLKSSKKTGKTFLCLLFLADFIMLMRWGGKAVCDGFSELLF